MGVLDILFSYAPAFGSGLTVTFQLAAAAWLVGIVLGGCLGGLAHFHPVSIGILIRATAFVLSAVPLLVLLYWLHFPVQVLLGIVVDPFVTAVFLFSVLNTVAVAEIWRSALDDVRNEYLVTARVCGLSERETAIQILFPLAFRQALPMLLAAQVFILQSTLFASLISVEELFRVAQRINSTVYKPIEIYTGLAVFFASLCLPLYLLAYHLRRRFTRDISEK